MDDFLMSEAPYLVISAFVLAVFLFIATRPFMPRAFGRRGLPILLVLLSTALYAHYRVGESRVEEVAAGFESGKLIFCSERRSKVGDRSIEVMKGDLWKREGEFFINGEGNKFSLRQCIVSDIAVR